MNLKKFTTVAYLIFAITFVLAYLVSIVVVGFVWAPLFASFVCLHYLLHQKRSVAEISIPGYIKVIMWIGIISLSSVWIFIGLILLASLEGAASDGSSAAWELLIAPFVLIPGIISTAVFFFFKTAAIADIRRINEQTDQAYVKQRNLSFVEITWLVMLAVILISALVYTLERYDYINLFDPEKTYTIQSPEFKNTNSIFYIQAEPHPPESNRPYSVKMRARSDEFDERVGYLGNWIPALVLYHEGKLFSLYNNEIAGVHIENLKDQSRSGGKGYTPSDKNSFDGDLVIIDEQVYVFEFLDPTCQRGVYNNCKGRLYPVGDYSQNYLQYQSRADEIASYQEFESSDRQTYEYLMIQNGELVPDSSLLFDKVSNELEIVPIILDEGISLSSENSATDNGAQAINPQVSPEVVDIESTYAVVGYISTVQDVGLGGTKDCPALLVTDATPLFSERLTAINKQHYERNLGQNFIEQEIGSDQFILFGWNWQRDLTQNERSIIENSTPNRPVTFSVSEIADPGPRGYDVCDLHETLKLELFDV